MLNRASCWSLMALALFVAADASALSWIISAEELRARHYDSLEECLRDVPFLHVERYGAETLPFRVLGPAADLGELLLVVDGMPWREIWSGANLFEELPLALLESVEVDTRPAVTEFGPHAAAGVIRVTTRRRQEASVETRFHLTKGYYGMRCRRVSFETPPGEMAVAVGLDEYYADGYFFSDYWGGEDSAVPASPSITYSGRRVLSSRLDLDLEGWGPLNCQLLQSKWHLDPYPRVFHENPKRSSLLLDLALPSSPWGAMRWQQSLIERRGAGLLARNLGLVLRWRLPELTAGGCNLGLSAGGASHRLSGQREGTRLSPVREADLWLATRFLAGRHGPMRLELGYRCDLRRDRRRVINYDISADWALRQGSINLGVFAAGGDERPDPRHDRLTDLSLWPEGLTEPAQAVGQWQARRMGAELACGGEQGSLSLLFVRREDEIDWRLRRDNSGLLRWTATESAVRHAMGLELGTAWLGRLGRVEANLGSLAELEDRHYLRANSDLGERAADPTDAYPRQVNLELRLSRPFFESDARLVLGGKLEYRSGLIGHADMWRFSVLVELRLIEARFWLKGGNMLDWPGEEIPAFPIQPVSISMGLDWHLGH